MSKAGQVIENPVIGERGVVCLGTEDSTGELLVVDAYVRPGGPSQASTSIRPSKSISRWFAGG